MSRPAAFALLLLLVAAVVVPSGALAAPASAPTRPYIVVVKGDPASQGAAGVASAAAVANNAATLDELAARAGLAMNRRFEHLVAGFSADLSAAQVRALSVDPDVARIVVDEPIELTAQSMPTGVARAGGRTSPAALIDGVDQRVDADVAVVDTGIDAAHPDLNVAGGMNCTSADPSGWGDENGHGTHVAGTIAALDNDIGVVGMAPGARLWAVRILDADGSGLLS
ncbi:MAG TPA: S8 family serine peptidase [Candidatus Limnocylindrales bacterium]|nr:S8 family serine peptidase [Candidatus Limnocylindrales bacterium]